MKITRRKLEEVFAMLPTVNVFLSNKEHSMARASSFQDVGGRDEDVFQNIKNIYIAKGDCNVDMAIEKFYSLGTRTVIQIKIDGEQKPIAAIIDEALHVAMLCEMARLFYDFRLVCYFTNLRNIVYILSPSDATSIIEKINKYIAFVNWARDVEPTVQGGQYIKDYYDLFRNNQFNPNDLVQIEICDALDLYNILDDNVEGIVPREALYPINMRYVNGKISADIVATISSACYKIKRFPRDEDERDISNIDIDNDDFVDDFVDKVFSEAAAEFVSTILEEYLFISIFAERIADGDIIIKFVDEEDVVCIARINPTTETIIW